MWGGMTEPYAVALCKLTDSRFAFELQVCSKGWGSPQRCHEDL